MKKIYTLALLAAVTASASALPPRNLPAKVGKSTTLTARKGNAPKSAKEATESDVRSKRGAKFHSPLLLDDAQGKWVAKTATAFFAEDDDVWTPESKLTATYDSNGRLTREVIEDLYDETGFIVSEYSYAENGHDVTVVNKIGETPEDTEFLSKWVREYDSRVPALLTKSYRYDWDGNDWVINGNSYHREVERDEAGNIVGVHYFTYYDNDFVEVQRVLVEYGEDGLPSTVTEWQLAYDMDWNEFWEQGYGYRNCKWHTTDGQIYSLDSIFEGSNRIASADQYDGDEFDCAMKVVFVGDSEDFTASATFEDGSTSEQVWENLPYGGVNNAITINEAFEDEDGEVDFETYSMIEREEFDLFGDTLLHYEYMEFSGEYEVMSWEQGWVQLNEDNLPLTWTLRSFLPDEEGGEWDDEMENEWYRPAKSAALTTPPVDGEWFDVYRMEYSDFELLTPSSGIASVVGSENAPVEYFSLDGRKVANPDAGIYVRRQGASVSKVVVR